MCVCKVFGSVQVALSNYPNVCLSACKHSTRPWASTFSILAAVKSSLKIRSVQVVIFTTSLSKTDFINATRE